MRLVTQRAWAAKGLLVAAATTTLIVTVLLTGLAEYGRRVADAGARSAVEAASAEERSLLVRGPAGGSAASLAHREAALRAAFPDGLAGLPTRVSAAGYATGRALTGPTGSAVPDSGGLVVGSVVFLDGLAERAVLSAGAWPRPGGRATETALTEPVAAALGVAVGDRIPILDRITGRPGTLTVVGVWRPRDPGDSYWRLVPGGTEGAAPQSRAYGPLVVHRDDFAAHFAASASVAWLVEPELGGADRAELARAGAAAEALAGTLPETTGLGSGGLVRTDLDDFATRLARADLVGRSALVTPLLLVLVLGGYTLLLVAMLLTEQRRGETALLRTRGAARNQLAGLVVREAALVVLPALALAPVLATEALRHAERIPAVAAVALRLAPGIDRVTWLVAGLAAAGCAAAMLVPALRRGGTFVGELASLSRPGRRSAVQRAAADLALVALAVLGWAQLRQYASPLAGADGGRLGIDPLLAATPTLGVLAGAVLGLRLLPPVARLVQRLVDRRLWTATVFGLWQAGRRPHAGPVLLLALAVAASTLAWSLAGSSEQSLRDQADHRVGADLRLVETGGSAPADRAEQLARLPGAAEVLPAWRDSVRLGAEAEPASVLALDAAAGAGVVRLRADLAGGAPERVFRELAAGRVAAPQTDLPPDARSLHGELRTTIAGTYLDPSVRSYAVFAGPGGGYRTVPLGVTRGDGGAVAFSVPLPAEPQPVRLAGFLVNTSATEGMRLAWRLTGLRTSPAPASAGTGTPAGPSGATGAPPTGPAGRVGATPVDLGVAGPWQRLGRNAPADRAPAGAGSLSADYTYRSPTGSTWGDVGVQLAVTRPVPDARLPVVATPRALAALRLAVGAETRISVGVAEVDVRIAGTVDELPGDTEPAAILVDLPSLGATLFHRHGIVPGVREWWVAAGPDQASSVATAVAELADLTVLDRAAVADSLARDPYGGGARAALFVAALGALLLAAAGIVVDVRATARRRSGELAVLHTLGAGPRLLARSLVAEQSFLAGTGVLVGLAIGVVVAAAMTPLVILTPAAGRPTPTPVLVVDWPPVLGTAVALLVLASALSGLVAARVRHRLAARLADGEQR